MPLTLTRSFFAIILPGLAMVGPWVLVVLLSYPSLGALYKEFSVPAQVSAFALVVTVGAIAEAVGNYVEKHWDNMVAAKAMPSCEEETWLDRDWLDYLSQSFGDGEPVGFRYLSRKVTELYFELGMMVAAPIGLFGLAFTLRTHVSHSICVGVFASLASFFLFFKFAKDTHCVLFDTRYKLMARIRK